MALDTELAKQVDKLLDDEESAVLLAMKVSKNQAAWTVAGRRGRVQSKPRVLAVTAKRNPQTQKYSVKIHIIKPLPQGLQLANVYKLSSLTSIEAEKSDSTGRSFYLVFDAKKDASLAQWAVRSIDDRNQLLVCLLKMSRENLGKMPKVVGMDLVEMAMWAQKNAKPLAIGATSATSTTSAGGAGGDEGTTVAEQILGEEKEGGLVSKVEEEDMEALLGTYTIGIDEAEAFSERLKRELAALEAANVHAILESEALVQEVLDRLDGAAESVEDMNEWLNVFNTKLRHMRDDIEQIEVRNNALGVQSQNMEGLLGELDKLLDCLQVPPQYAAVLTGGPLEEASIAETGEACDWLCDTLEILEPAGSGATEESFSQMRAIREKRVELEGLKTTFVRRATDFLRTFLSVQVENMIGKTMSRGFPDHKDLRRKCRVFARMLQHVKILDEGSLSSVRKAYCHSVNLLLRREAREFAGELKGGRGDKRPPGGGAGAATWLEGGGPVPSAAESSAASDSYTLMLRLFLPVLAEEGVFFAAYMVFDSMPPNSGDQLSQEVVDMAADLIPVEEGAPDLKELLEFQEDLYDGVQEDFHALVDWAYKVDTLRCITMLSQTEQWLQRYGVDEMGFVHGLLTELHRRIRQLFFKYVDEAAAQIEKQDARAPKQQAGVLSFIPRFATLAMKMEGLVGEGSSRDMVDQAYGKLVSTMFAVLERSAQSDAKHADVLLLENYAAFQNSTYELAGSLPILRKFYQLASEAYERACIRFIEQIINAQFESLFTYMNKLSGVLATVDAEEIPFQVGFSKTDLRKTLKSQLTGADKSLRTMYIRMQKSLTSGDLLPSLWQKCQEVFMKKYYDWETLVANCYQNEQLSPSSAEMADLFQSASVQ